MALTNDYISMFLYDNGNKPFISDNNVFKLNHGTEYKIRIENHHPTLRADVKVSVDGKSIGEFRVNNQNKITVERPVKSARKLTFFAIDSNEGNMAALSFGNPDLGIIEIRARMEKKHTSLYLECDGEDEVDLAGGTGLGVKSNQQFVNVPDITLDTKVVVIKARLVLVKEPVVVPL